MRTCWVLDHPAHVRLLAPFLRAGQSDDVIIATQRKEVENLLQQGDGHLPRRQTHWVERPVGKNRRKKALLRWSSSHRFLRQCNQSGEPIRRIVSIGAPLELMAWKSPFLRRRLKSIKERWYITDTEVNHIAHSPPVRLLPMLCYLRIGEKNWTTDLCNHSNPYLFIASMACMVMCTYVQAVDQPK